MEMIIVIVVAVDSLEAILSRSNSEKGLCGHAAARTSCLRTEPDSTLLPTPRKNNVHLGLHASHCLQDKKVYESCHIRLGAVCGGQRVVWCLASPSRSLHPSRHFLQTELQIFLYICQ